MLVPLVVGVACALALITPYKAPVATGSPPGSVWTLVEGELLAAGDPGRLMLAAVVLIGAFLPAVGLTLATIPGGGILTSLQRVLGVFTVLFAAVLYGAIGLSLTRFSFGGGTHPHNLFATAIPRAYGVAGLLTLMVRPRSRQK